MIDHSQCDHPRTSSARAKCRRAAAGGDAGPKRKASTKEVDFEGSGGAKPQTPRDKGDECHTCGVERIEFYGRDAFTGLPVMVGEKCAWRVKRSPEFRAVTR